MSMDSTAGSVNGAGPSHSQNKGYQNDTLNPYFLHPNENPNLALVSPLLSGPNYHSWSRAMTMALRSKNKMHFINGTLPRPDDEDPFEIWKDLKEQFYQGDVFRISDLQEEIFSLKQGDSSILTYYTNMKKLWQELENFRPIPETSCVDHCAAIAKMKSYRDSDQVIRFLKGLNELYYDVRSQIMLMEPLPNIGKVYSLLVQQERQIVTPIDESKLLVVFGLNQSAGRGYSYRCRGSRGGRSNGGRSRPYGNGKGNKLCSYCGQTNHVVDDCWKKYGYPPHMQHFHQDGAVNNCANTNGDDDDTPTVNCEDDDNNDQETGNYSLTAAQHKALLALLQGSTSLSSHSINHVTTKTGKFIQEDDWCS
ncbi:hypothetical protein TSUD_179070 [Trifolium subterraneum]|uniref:Retrotransposon Copia-like N-terminal domain-containing protein n=1 Tax=Trifolium subterraneum TaxID=3900 RepID=A0A2Z6LVR0_TRISU|nr:hypothetical protein TSUD_179070 [Trifolium subterraneum]